MSLESNAIFGIVRGKPRVQCADRVKVREVKAGGQCQKTKKFFLFVCLFCLFIFKCKSFQSVFFFTMKEIYLCLLGY